MRSTTLNNYSTSSPYVSAARSKAATGAGGTRVGLFDRATTLRTANRATSLPATRTSNIGGARVASAARRPAQPQPQPQPQPQQQQQTTASLTPDQQQQFFGHTVGRAVDRERVFGHNPDAKHSPLQQGGSGGVSTTPQSTPSTNRGTPARGLFSPSPLSQRDVSETPSPVSSHTPTFEPSSPTSRLFGGLSSTPPSPSANAAASAASGGGARKSHHYNHNQHQSYHHPYLLPNLSKKAAAVLHETEEFRKRQQQQQQQQNKSPMVKSPSADDLGDVISSPTSPASHHCIVFDLDETLCCNRGPGRAILRPGALELLRELAAARDHEHRRSGGAKGVEIVLWTASCEDVGREVVRRLDPHGAFFDHLIFRDARWFRNEANYTKDLKLLGRDMAQCCIIENSPASVRLNRQHAILVKDFMGMSYRDTDLYAVRDVLLSWISNEKFVSIDKHLTAHPMICSRTNSVKAANGGGGGNARAAAAPSYY